MNPSSQALPVSESARATGLEPAYYEKSQVYAFFHTALPILLFIGLGWWARAVQGPLEAIPVFLIMGLALYQLYFPLHDCSHYSLFLTRSQNRFFGAVLSSLLFARFDSFRDAHLLHHRAYGSLTDPGSVDYWITFKSRFAMLRFLMAPIIGASIFIKIKDYYATSPTPEQVMDLKNGERGGGWTAWTQLALVQLAVLLLMVKSPSEIWRYFAFYIFPAGTIFLFLSRLRMFLEHGSLDYGKLDYTISPRPMARTITSFFPENVILCNMDFNYHREHHDYPQVPSCRLRRLHASRTKNVSETIEDVNTYCAALAKLWRHLGK